MTEQELRKIVKDAGVRLLKENLVQGTWGNISVRIDENKMLVTPSGMDYIRMTEDDLVVVDINTLEYESNVKPTSEKKIHAAIYRQRPDIGAVIHSHPSYCCSVASARRDMPVTDEEVKMLVGGEKVRMGDYGLSSTKTLTKATIAALGTDMNACFMANHGMMACGKDMEDAFAVCRAMEEGSKKFIEAECAKRLGKDEFEEGDLERLFRQKYAK